MADSDRVGFHFEASELTDESLHVVGVEGREAISRLYRFSIELVSDNHAVDLETLLQSPARLTLDQGGAIFRSIDGVLSHVEQLDSHTDFARYRVELVPRLWWLTLTTQNQIYQDKSVEDVVADELLGAGLARSDFEFVLNESAVRSGTAGPKEYRVQFRESNLHFVDRLLEHEGFYYFFREEDDDSGRSFEKIRFCDSADDTLPIGDGLSLPYRPTISQGLHDEANAMLSWRYRVKQVPEKVRLREYNYRIPKVMLDCEARVPDGDRGQVRVFGDHFANQEAGRFLARVRAEQVRASRQVFEGESSSPHLRAGHRFSLDEHPHHAFCQTYLVTSVEHRVTLPNPLHAHGQAFGDDEDAASQRPYRARVTAIPVSVPYRPPQVTEKPRVRGVMSAWVESESGSPYAEIDDEGRYRVRLTWDVGDAAEGRASRFLRMAQPYVGESEGTHFPLRAGTEVLWACVDGDPDRPVILGAVPNPDNPSQVTAGNRSQSVIRTASGVLIQFNDVL
ncbi:MAG: type VI secretion system Vgr family protein [Myxococcota bacterium]